MCPILVFALVEPDTQSEVELCDLPRLRPSVVTDARARLARAKPSSTPQQLQHYHKAIYIIQERLSTGLL